MDLFVSVPAQPGECVCEVCQEIFAPIRRTGPGSKSRYVDRRRCPACEKLRADLCPTHEQWLYAAEWCRINVGVVRKAYRQVRPDLLKMWDLPDLLNEATIPVARALQTWRTGQRTEFATYAYQGIVLYARQLPDLGPVAHGCDKLDLHSYEMDAVYNSVE